MASNPASGKRPRDGAVHVVRVEAPGYEPREEQVTFDRSLLVTLELRASGAAPADNPPTRPQGGPQNESPAVRPQVGSPNDNPPRAAPRGGRPWRPAPRAPSPRGNGLDTENPYQ